jgi:hypothetical protein
LIAIKSFDYIYTAAFSLAILSWSITMLLTQKMPAWIGWMGISIAVISIVIIFAGVAVNNLFGLRIFGALIVAWTLLMGINLYKQR